MEKSEYAKYIENYYIKNLHNKINSNEIGATLMCGAYYFYTKNNIYNNYTCELIDPLLENIDSDYSFRYGWAGIIWLTYNLKKTDLLSNANELTTYGVELLSSKLEGIINANYLDYFSGAGGIINCLIEIDSFSDKLALLWINNIKEKLKYNSFKAWRLASDDEKNENKLNLGVPHGLVGYLLIALKLKQVTDIKLDDLIIALTKKLLSHQSASYKYHFPAYIKENNRESPSVLAWCHGDLMAAYAILKAGLVLNNSEFKNIGLKILKECTLRNDIFPNNLTLCHGTTSVAYIFYKTYLLTNDKDFEWPYKKWKNISNEIIENQFKDYENNKSFFEDSSLFTGISGFILANLTMDNKISSEWDSCLLF